MECFNDSVSKPNIVLICADDIGFNEIGAYQGMGMPDRDVFAGEKVHTPHMDSIAREGALLTRYYATSPICTPSRYSILTGRLASRSPSIIEDFPPPAQATITWNTRIDKDEGTIGKAFKSMGYATGYVGKWHNHQPRLNMEKEIADNGDPHNHEYNSALRKAYYEQVEYIRNGFGFDYADRIYFGNREASPKPVQVHNLEWLAEGAEEFITDHKDESFFLYLAFSAPHGDHFTDFLHIDPCLTPAGLLDTPPKSSMPLRTGIPARLAEAGISEKTAMSTWMDDCIGAVLKRLDDCGLRENTVVVFTCDHLARGKYMCYEGARVPFIIRWPAGIPEGQQLDKLCANIYLVSTLTDLADGGLNQDYITDGMSFAPLLTGPETDTEWRDHLFLEVSNIRAIVTDKWKYIACSAAQEILDAIEEDKKQAESEGRKRYVGWDGRRNPHAGFEKEGIRYFAAGEFPHYFDPDQLYDLESDVFEQNNLIHDPKHSVKAEQLKNLLKNKLKKLPHSFGEFTNQS
jgi:arylsulfatase A-like enzyme